jgi:predicted PurR-regulated permease PerM
VTERETPLSVDKEERDPSPGSAEEPLTTRLSSLITLQVTLAVVAALYFAREILIPVAIAILLSFVLGPIVHFLRRLKLGRVPSVLLAVVVGVSLLTAIGGVVGTQAAQVAQKLPEYTFTIERKIKVVRAYTVDRISDAIERFGYLTHKTEDHPRQKGTEAEATKQPQKSDSTKSAGTEAGVVSFVEKYVPSVLSPIASVGIVLIVTLFVLLQKEDLRDRVIRLLGAGDLHRTTAALDDAAGRLSRYFLTQLGINIVFGMTVGVGLHWIGVPNPMLWAILAAIFRFVPYVGALLSASLPIALAAAVDPGWTMAVWTFGLYLVAELIVSQVAEPILYGHSTGMSPFAVIVSAIFWTWIWGPIGLVLSTPMTLCFLVLGRHVERLSFFEVLLGDQPALTPVESFYQRLLAGDLDEVQEHAEVLLKEKSLSSYYDDVALKGMRLAAEDAHRRVLRPHQLGQMAEAIRGLVQELSGYRDEDPIEEKANSDKANPQPKRTGLPTLAKHEALRPQWQTKLPVLCLAGKGPLDEAASAMLSQLLEKHGIGARVGTYRSASRYAIDSLDCSGIAMVCISYLHISGQPPHLRYLIRRLRQKMPEVAILVGLWQRNETITEEQKAAVGADYYTATLTEAVEACLSEATKDRVVSDVKRESRSGSVVGPELSAVP